MINDAKRVKTYSLHSPLKCCCGTSGSKVLDYPNGMFDCQSPTSPFMGSLRALHLLEDLRGVLEMMDTEERESLRCQIPDSTADSLVEWLHGHMVGKMHITSHNLTRGYLFPLQELVVPMKKF